MIKDSYQVFLDDFNIKKDDFYRWGISSTIFPNIDKVEEVWLALKKRIFSNQVVYIRGYGRDANGTQLYKDLYKAILGNDNVIKDPTNNAIPHKHIQQLTGLKRNKDIYNYQVSHIWGRTKNLFLFEAPWNICFTPKMIDPFTGHETMGAWPKEYQELFLKCAYDKYKPFINDYNQILIDNDICSKIDLFLESIKLSIPHKEFEQFKRDVYSEFSPIIL